MLEPLRQETAVLAAAVVTMAVWAALKPSVKATAAVTATTLVEVAAAVAQELRAGMRRMRVPL